MMDLKKNQKRDRTGQEQDEVFEPEIDNKCSLMQAKRINKFNAKGNMMAPVNEKENELQNKYKKAKLFDDV
jgi:hypothetical protein